MVVEALPTPNRHLEIFFLFINQQRLTSASTDKAGPSYVYGREDGATEIYSLLGALSSLRAFISAFRTDMSTHFTDT